MANKKILVTGTLGFIGSNFIRKATYNKSPYTFISVDKAALPSSLNNIYINKCVSSHYLADITDEHIIDKIFEIEKPDFVINFAAETFVDYSLTDPNKFIKSNVLGTQVLVNASVKHKIEKFIQISTDECYGHLTSENDASWTEESVINPRNPYSASKASAELVVKAASESFGLKYNITRTSNNYGPRQGAEKLIPKIIKCIFTDQKIPIYGQGLQIRDWTHVFDNCSGIMTVLEKGKDNEIYNISANQEYTNIEVVHEICNILGKGHNLIEHIADPRGNGHDFRYSINCDKLKSLGWKPEIKFKSGGLEDCVQWFNNNKWWFR